MNKILHPAATHGNTYHSWLQVKYSSALYNSFDTKRLRKTTATESNHNLLVPLAKPNTQPNHSYFQREITLLLQLNTINPQ